MPMFLCPYRGESSPLSLPVCEFILVEHLRNGWDGTAGVTWCVACQGRQKGEGKRGKAKDVPLKVKRQASL
jgi:hypothetical protein